MNERIFAQPTDPFVRAIHEAPPRNRKRSRWERMRAYPITKGPREKEVDPWNPQEAQEWALSVIREVGGPITFEVTETLRGPRLLRWHPR